VATTKDLEITDVLKSYRFQGTSVKKPDVETVSRPEKQEGGGHLEIIDKRDPLDYHRVAILVPNIDLSRVGESYCVVS
jgi:hypothetical protein